MSTPNLSDENLNSIKVILQIFLGITILYLMSVLSSQLIPLFFALFFAVLLQPLVHFFQRFFRVGISVVLTVVLAVGTFFFLGYVFFNAVQSLVSNSQNILQDISTELRPFINSYTKPIGFEFKEGEIANNIATVLQTGSFWSASGSFITTISGAAAELLMTLLYFAGLLGAITEFDKTIHYLVDRDNKETKTQTVESFKRIKESVSKYIKVKTLVSIVTGICIGLICWFFGIQYALLWGFLGFILNYIPYLGSLIAIVPPLVISIIQYGSVSQMLILFVCLEGVQLVMGNVIEPKWMGDSFSINTVSVLFGFVFWAYLWGTAGMLLAVPLTFMFKVISENISSAQIIVRLMDKKSLTRKA
jgi:predicted PurR-regulated permease PerM